MNNTEKLRIVTQSSNSAEMLATEKPDRYKSVTNKQHQHFNKNKTQNASLYASSYS